MKDLEHLVSGIDYKIHQLIEKHKDLEANIEILRREKEELSKDIRQQVETIDNLERKIKILNITKSIDTGKGASEAKLKINELVREIDKCIGLLNK